MVRVSRDVEQNHWQVTVGSDSDLMLNNRKRLPASKPLRWTVATEPTIDAPNYRGVAKTRPPELKWLGEETIAPVQHLANDKQSTQGLIESLPVPPADPNAAATDKVQPAGATTPPFQQAWQPPNTATPGEVIAPDVPMTPAAPSDQGGKFQIFLNGGTQSLEVTSRSSSTSAQLESFNRPETGETIVVARVV